MSDESYEVPWPLEEDKHSFPTLEEGQRRWNEYAAQHGFSVARRGSEDARYAYFKCHASGKPESTSTTRKRRIVGTNCGFSIYARRQGELGTDTANLTWVKELNPHSLSGGDASLIISRTDPWTITCTYQQENTYYFS
ncbi:hypothetical protein GEMRC1_003393 [Eukaryota sp. GEM-RC1]